LKRLKFATLAVVCMLALAFSSTALADITIDPATTPNCGSPICIAATGNQTAQPQIDAAIAGFLGTATELYKANVGGAEEGSLAGSYETVFNPATNPTGATITYVGGSIVAPPSWLLVKDGNAEPAWYLFHLNDGVVGWDGTETLVLENFWAGTTGAISHVTLYGTPGTSVPDGGMTLAFLGAALFGLETLRRRLRA
jgi:hypothetical protein